MLSYVIGDGDMVTGFRLVGIEGAEVCSAADAWGTLTKVLNRTDLAVIIVSEEFSKQPHVHEIIEDVRRERRTPIILELPGSRGKPSETKMSDLISKTLGVKL